MKDNAKNNCEKCQFLQYYQNAVRFIIYFNLLAE